MWVLAFFSVHICAYIYIFIRNFASQVDYRAEMKDLKKNYYDPLTNQRLGSPRNPSVTINIAQNKHSLLHLRQYVTDFWTNLIGRRRSWGSRDWEGLSLIPTFVHSAYKFLLCLRKPMMLEAKNSKRRLLSSGPAQPPWRNVCHLFIHNFLGIWWIIWRYLWHELMIRHGNAKIAETFVGITRALCRE